MHTSDLNPNTDTDVDIWIIKEIMAHFLSLHGNDVLYFLSVPVVCIYLHIEDILGRSYSYCRLFLTCILKANSH